MLSYNYFSDFALATMAVILFYSDGLVLAAVATMASV